MKRIALVFALLAVFASCGLGETIAFWHFDDVSDSGVDGGLWQINPLGPEWNPWLYENDLGSGYGYISTVGSSIIEGNLLGTNGGDNFDNYGGFVGTVINDIRTTPEAGYSLAVVGQGNNGHYFMIQLDDAIAGAQLSYATRGTLTGFTTQDIYYSNNGGQSWVHLTTEPSNMTATWSTTTVGLGDIFASSYGAAANLLRIELSGATGDNGNNRFDNILITGTMVPEPATVMLVASGITFLGALRRRKG